MTTNETLIKVENLYGTELFKKAIKDLIKRLANQTRNIYLVIMYLLLIRRYME